MIALRILALALVLLCASAFVTNKVNVLSNARFSQVKLM